MRRILLQAALVAAFFALPAVAQTARDFRDVAEIPDTPAGKRLLELLDVINSGDRARAERYVEEAFDPESWADAPAAEHAAFLMRVHEGSGELRFHSVRRYDPPYPDEQIVAIVRTGKTDVWQGISLSVATDPPHRIKSLVVNRARPPTDVPSGPLSEEELGRQLGDFLDQLARKDLFSGVVLVARDGRILFQGARGQAEKSFAIPNRADTRFNLASMNKMFTAVAIGQLAERGKLSLDDPVSRVLGDGWLDPGLSRKILIRHLLSHTSGLGDFLDDERYRKAARAGGESLERYRPLLATEKADFEPGTGWGYSNTGYLVLGAVIETLSGVTYEEYLEKNLLGPAGMSATGCAPTDLPVPDLAVGYVKVEPLHGVAYRTNTLRLHGGSPAGGCYSTAGDLLRFDQALRSGKLLGRKVLRRLWTTTPESRARLPYGMGFTVLELPGDTVVGHGGGIDGVSDSFEMHLGTGVTAIVLANYGGAAHAVTSKLAELLPRLAGNREPENEGGGKSGASPEGAGKTGALRRALPGGAGLRTGQ